MIQVKKHTRKKKNGVTFVRKHSRLTPNKPLRTPSHPTKSHIVLASEGGVQKTIRFGQQGVKGSPKKVGESEAYKKRRESFKARHAKNISKGKLSAAYWADKVKW